MSNDSSAAAPGQRRSILSMLSEDFKSFAWRRSFGDPVQVGDQQVIPVALVKVGFGGGGSGNDGGGGGGGAVLPVGILAADESGRATFVPNPIAVLAVMIPLVWASGHAVARIISAARNR
ncbi:hypothetical protein [Arthrobacter sp. USHLN218]|uniref:hypothetical protein n=1 Tax=Arthrobacter sp. USHLN218 TaxID=3081232 RepID=UPI0030194896